MARDELFLKNIPWNKFNFDEKVAKVFDDMVKRSIPNYNFITNSITLIANKYLKKNTNCYDLGCSLGTLSLALLKIALEKNNTIIAVDNAEPMLKKFNQKLNKVDINITNNIKIINDDICNISYKNASLIMLNFVLQFVEYKKRQELLTNIYNGLNKEGCLLLSEKIIEQDEQTNQIMIDLYHDFKKLNKYSINEIAKKSKALENVLIPEKIEDHYKKLKQIGFSKITLWSKAFNFISILAIK